MTKEQANTGAKGSRGSSPGSPNGPQRAVIVGVRHGKITRRQMERSLEELRQLVETAGGEVVGELHQEMHRFDPATFIGSGKAAEVATAAQELDADMVIIDDDLSPVQNRNLEEAIGALVLDRTAIILDIFARRAKSREGKLQVELAQLEYLGPRLVGRGESFSQQTGGIGTRGPGETALEIDRRLIKNRISLLHQELKGLMAHRQANRAKREAAPVPLISIVGYTNAGKSTLMNALTNAGVFVEDKLFATLDPTVRQLKLPSGRTVLLADTVGFIRRLPHQLIESFKSTFEEVAHSQLLLHLIDGSDEEAVAHVEIVARVLRELSLDERPVIEIVNKCDVTPSFYSGSAQTIAISALRGTGIDAMLARLDEILRHEFRHVTLKIPFDHGEILPQIYRTGYVLQVEHEDDGVKVVCELHEKYYQKFREYAV